MQNLLLCKKTQKDYVKDYSELLLSLATVGKGAYISPRSCTVLSHEI